MKNVTTAEFKPTEIWTPKSADFELEEPIERALKEMNKTDPIELAHALKNKVEHSKDGLAFAVLNGDNPDEYSDTEALVLLDSYSVGPSPNRLIRAEFIRQVAKQANIRDQAGKYKPVIMVASPGLGSSLRLNKEDRQAVKQGELGLVAEKMLRAISHKEVGEITLLGFSQGASIALAGARKSYGANLDNKIIAIGDPPTVEHRSPLTLLKDFSKASDLSPSIEATGLNAQKKYLTGTAGKIDGMRLVLGVTKPINLLLWKALGTGSFESNVQQVINEGRIDRLVIGYGSESAITKPEYIEPVMEHLQGQEGYEILTSIRVEGANHTWGDQLTLLAKLYLRALT